ncbi:UvrD-helicase domain-containing protein [Thermosulfurimonas sp. F29]|uniref:UvrD-helicase domain-containing protein n=1 Tax=Thermosulfurimonas sp. F29 TaxID=2867247 RepID=UPI001C83661C|nr:UvrD-helicase domain-containing protein [Thermosulfurimonas sp. F29]MBX6422113.1 UvrD-helicase domain-containing protein [Thermosulfurimonas sp. F29]
MGLELDEDQRKAVAVSGSALVVAGPGAGKTRVLLGRALHLLGKGVPTERIFLLTFTVRTRQELRDRLSALGISGIRVETFHALAYDLIAEATGSPPRLVSEEEAEALVGKLLKKHGLKGSPRRVLEKIRAGDETLEPLRREYLEYLSARGLFDYYRLLLYAPEIVRADFSNCALLIDEYQDLSPEMLSFLRIFSGAEFFLVGDPAQAIYGFRGARPEILQTHLREIVPELRLLTLKRSYRVPEALLGMAEGLREDPFGLKVRLSAMRPGGTLKGLVFPTEKSEAVGVAKEVAALLGGVYLESSGRGGRVSPGDILVLARLRALLSRVREALLREGVPVAEPEERAAETLERLRSLAESFSSGALSRGDLAREVRALAPHVAELVLEPDLERERISARLKLLSLADVISGSREGVNLVTIHGAKGLEAEAVVLVGAEEGLVPLTLFPDTDPSEEKRLLYVALTRARETFIFTVSRARTLFGKRLPGRPSPWLATVPLAEGAPRPVRRPAQGTLFTLLLILLLGLLPGLGRAETLRECLHRFTPVLLKRHPALSALSARIRAQEKRIAPAGALPDPRISFVVRNVGDPVPANTLGEEPMSLTGLRIEERLPWRGKRRARRDLVSLEEKILRVRYRQRVWSLWGDLAETLLEAAYLETEARVLDDLSGTLVSLEESARARYEAGKGLQADIFRAATERSLLTERIRRNRERRRILRERLEKRLLFTPFSRLPELALPRRLPPLPGRETLLALMDKSPRVVLYRLRLRRREVSAHLAELNRYPDLKVFAGWYSRGPYPEIYEFGVGISVPLFISRKQEPLWEAAKEEVVSSKKTLEDIKSELRYRLEEWLVRAETEAELVRLYQEEVLPRAEADFESARSYYGTGTLDFLNVLERWRRLLEYRLGLERHRINYLLALVRMQTLLGASLTPELPGPEGGGP